MIGHVAITLYISDYLWPYLIYSEVAKITNKDIYIIAANIKNIYAKNTYISSIYTINTKIKYANIKIAYIRCIYISSVFIESIKLRILIKSRIILLDLKINNYYFDYL